MHNRGRRRYEYLSTANLHGRLNIPLIVILQGEDLLYRLILAIEILVCILSLLKHIIQSKWYVLLASCIVIDWCPLMVLLVDPFQPIGRKKKKNPLQGVCYLPRRPYPHYSGVISVII